MSFLAGRSVVRSMSPDYCGVQGGVGRPRGRWPVMRTSAGPNAEGIRRVETKASLANAQFENGMQSARRLWCAQLGFMQEGGIVIGPSKFV